MIYLLLALLDTWLVSSQKLFWSSTFNVIQGGAPHGSMIDILVHLPTEL